MSTDIKDFRQAHGSDKYGGLLCDIGSGLECAICQSLMFAPFVLDCGHNYCYPCLKAWFDDNNSCPECRTKIVKAPTHSLTLKRLAETISEKMCEVDSSLKKPFKKRKKEQVKPYEKDVKKNRLFPAFFSQGTHAMDEEDGVPRCVRCHWELEDDEDTCTNCGIWVNGTGREGAASIDVDDDEESDSRRPDEEISDYEDDGFVVNDEEEGDDIEGDVTILSDSQASSPAPTASSIQINDSDFDSEDEQLMPNIKRQNGGTIDDSDEEHVQPRRKHIISDSDEEPAVRSKSRKISSDSEDEPQPSTSRSRSNGVFTDSEDEQPTRRLKKKRGEVVVLSDESSENESETDNEGITEGVYTGLPSRGSDSEGTSEDGSDEGEDLSGFLADEAEDDGFGNESGYSEEY